MLSYSFLLSPLAFLDFFSPYYTKFEGSCCSFTQIQLDKVWFLACKWELHNLVLLLSQMFLVRIYLRSDAMVFLNPRINKNEEVSIVMCLESQHYHPPRLVHKGLP